MATTKSYSKYYILLFSRNNDKQHTTTTFRKNPLPSSLILKGTFLTQTYRCRGFAGVEPAAHIIRFKRG